MVLRWKVGRYIVLEIKVLEVVYLRLTGISSPHHNAAAFLVSICSSACSPPHMSMLGHSSRLFPMLQAGLFWMWKHSELAGMPSALGKLLGSAHTGHGNAESPLSDTRNSPGDPAAGTSKAAWEALPSRRWSHDPAPWVMFLQEGPTPSACSESLLIQNLLLLSGAFFRMAVWGMELWNSLGWKEPVRVI